MKPLILLAVLLLTWSVAFAQPVTLEKRTKTVSGKKVIEYFAGKVLVRVEGFSIKTNQDGSPLAGFSKIFQDGKIVAEENWGPGPIRQRTFFRDGTAFLTESDKNGDGIFEWVVISKADGEPYAIFRAARRGELELLGTNALSEYSQGLELGSAVVGVITNIENQVPNKQAERKD